MTATLGISILTGCSKGDESGKAIEPKSKDSIVYALTSSPTGIFTFKF